MSLRPLLASRKAARAFALVLAVCLGLSIMLGAAAPESDADEVPPFRFTGRMGQGVCDTLWVWAHHLDEARQDVLTEQSLQAARRAEPAPSADDDRTPNAASSLICFLGEEGPYRQGEPADITAPDGYASTWVGTGCVSDNANTYFIGHNPGVFERVMDLEIGDKITVFDDDGASRTYYVFDTLFLPNGSSTRAASRRPARPSPCRPAPETTSGCAASWPARGDGRERRAKRSLVVISCVHSPLSDGTRYAGAWRNWHTQRT